jgi:hypothetical protein
MDFHKRRQSNHSDAMANDDEQEPDHGEPPTWSELMFGVVTVIYLIALIALLGRVAL